MSVVVLDDSSMPAAFRSADTASLAGQGDTIRQVQWALRLGILAAAGGITSWRVGAAKLDVLAGLAGVAFVASLFFTLKLGADRAEERWYRGRAIAESIKTLAWRYAVGGDPFASSLDALDADRLFVDRVDEVVKKADQLQLAPVVGEQITAAMRELRGQTLADRRESYCIGRVDDQMHWYANKAAANGDSARRWSRAAAASNVIGILGSGARFLGWVEFDILGIAAAAAGSATAWVQLKQHRILASSYALASQELSLVRERLAGVADEDAWSLEMSDAEDAISREHTMWLARHGHS